jgi:hypothetical protein
MVNKLSRDELFLFVIVFLSSAFFSRIDYQTSNYAARLFLTQAIVDHHTFELGFRERRLGYDWSYYNGRFYSDKPPGSSLMMIPQYVLLGKPADFILQRINPYSNMNEAIVAWLVQITSLSLYAAMGFIGLYRIFGLLELRERQFSLALFSFFGTLMFPFSTIGNGEMFTTPVVIWAFVFLLRAHSTRDFLYSGLCFGLACLTNYQTIFFAATAACFVLYRNRRTPALWLVFGFPVAFSWFVLLLYDKVIFGSFLTFPVKYWRGGFDVPTIVFELPSAAKLLDMLFLPWKGIFFYSPFLLLSVLGYLKLARRQPPDVALLLASSFISFFLFLAANAGWYGGNDFGFRYIVPALPFLCIGSAAWLSKRSLHILESVLIALSVFVCSLGAVTSAYVAANMKNPLTRYNIPIFLSHATNNILNDALSKGFGLDSWPLRFASTVLFFGLIAGLLLLRSKKKKLGT